VTQTLAVLFIGWLAGVFSAFAFLTWMLWEDRERHEAGEA
jgi:hypothetical protein